MTIQTTTSSTFRNNMSDIIKEISKKKSFMLITKKGEPISAVVNIDLMEDLLSLSSKKYLRAIKKARKDYRDGKIFTHEQVSLHDTNFIRGIIIGGQ